MPNSTQQMVAGRAARIAEARAGIIFKCDHVAAELLAATSNIVRALKAYARSAKPEPDDRVISDILVDLRHYCDSKQLVFDEINAEAEEHYWHEKADLA